MRRRVHVVRTWTMRSILTAAIITFTVTLGIPERAFAQVLPVPPPPPVLPVPPPPPPPPGWAGNISAGLAITNGNANTSNFNLALKATFDPENPHLLTMDALYLRGSNEGETNVSRTSLNAREDYSLTERASVFGQLRYLRDTFKGIDYLAAPTLGVGYKVVNLERTRFNVDAGAGVVWERDSEFGMTTTDGAITAGETFTHNLTATTVITHGAMGLWKAADFADSLYTVGLGLSAALTARIQLKLEVLELYKSQPPPGKLNQDVSFLTSVVYSF
jgi:putative salt-induced outer membrane protein